MLTTCVQLQSNTSCIGFAQLVTECILALVFIDWMYIRVAHSCTQLVCIHLCTHLVTIYSCTLEVCIQFDVHSLDILLVIIQYWLLSDPSAVVYIQFKYTVTFA